MKWRFCSSAKGQSWSSVPGQRAKVSVQTWVVVSAKLGRASGFRGRGRSLGKSFRSVVAGRPVDGVGPFLVVHLQHIIFVFDRSGSENKGNPETLLSHGMFLQLNSSSTFFIKHSSKVSLSVIKVKKKSN